MTRDPKDPGQWYPPEVVFAAKAGWEQYARNLTEPTPWHALSIQMQDDWVLIWWRMKQAYDANQSHPRLSDILADLPAGTWLPDASPGSFELGRSADGTVWFTLVFRKEEDRNAFLTRYSRKWIIASDRACLMSYHNTWKDVCGYGLTLTSSDFPVSALGGKRNSELREFKRCRSAK